MSTRPARAATCPGHLLPACLPPPPPGRPGDATRLPDPLSLLPRSLDPLLLLCSPSLSSPNAPESAARRSHDHRPPLVPWPCPAAPQSSTTSPSRRKRAGGLCFVANVLIFTAGARRSSPSIRRFPSVPEATDFLRRLPVSSSSLLFARPLRSRPLAIVPQVPEARRRGHCHIELQPST